MRRLALALLIAPLLSFAAPQEPPYREEVGHLLSYLEHSGCQFQRNGSWHDAAEAAAHLERKYHYLLDKGLLASTEDFIAHAASQSSLSGQAYQVRCAAEPSQPSADWLRRELLRHRQAR